MNKENLYNLIERLETYNKWKFVNKDKAIRDLIADIKDTAENLETPENLNTYEVKYNFNGHGKCLVEAETEEEAEEMFWNGEYDNEKEWGDDYELDNVKKINN